ncbi:hypothetical protein C2134_15695 [Chromobacterium sinusclupearum]|uniref:Uncharacterized protein n=1 Tax=Chromobacterium sinusclupearum TaxID=2077146 RepID=A0A2K4MJP3_9NEIS|nr:hypothetical protein C2134_15695 [Chromobacterium sinusclupearum]
MASLWVQIVDFGQLMVPNFKEALLVRADCVIWGLLLFGQSGSPHGSPRMAAFEEKPAEVSRKTVEIQEY